jgi:serine/threonine protein kinase
MFSCTGDILKSCKQGAKIKKIGDYFYHYDFMIGSGTYSKVYEGVSMITDKPVAIKVVDLDIIKQRNLSNLLFQ